MSTDARRIPKLLPLPAGKTVQSFPLSTIDGFVLSRIDGTMSDMDLIALTGLDEASVRGSLEKLTSLGLIAIGGENPRMSRPPAATETKRASTIPPRPITEDAGPRRLSSGDLRMDDIPAPRGLYDPGELDEDVDIERDHRQKILDAFYRLDSLDYYALLGVPRSADKKAIKRAYYEAAGLFHPDRYFRKRLGSFKAKMEHVFARMSLASETLTVKEAREEYDAYLGEQRQAAAIEADLQEPTPPPPPPLRPEPAPAAQVPASPAPVATPPRVAVSEQARRDALARRLLGARSSPPPAQRSPAPPGPADPEALRRHYENRVNLVRDHMIKEHVASAKDAMAKDDPIGAANAYRLAVGVAPEDPELRDALAQAQALANVKLGESYRKQASYEEKSGRYNDAARSWARAAKVLPDDVDVHERAASAAIKADEGTTNLHEAAALAQRAVTLSGGKPSYRVTLAQVYLAAGLNLNAKRELEAALQLAPGDATIQGLLKRVGSKA